MLAFDSTALRLRILVAVAVAAACCVGFFLVGSASANAEARATSAANHTAYVSDYASRDWCDDTNEVDWDDCDPGDWTSEPPPEDPGVIDPSLPTAPTGPVEPPEPIQYWPAPPKGAYATLRANGRTAVVPKSAPAPVKAMIKAANRLTRKPYKWGGGHGRWSDQGYDCSGAVSYVLHAAGKLGWPMVSGGLARWGVQGSGRWVHIYANKGHVFMVIAGLRFDTSGRGESGPRWRPEPRFTKGFRLRHPAGL
jgi:hypothetical protein